MLRHDFIKLGFLDGWKGVVPEGRREEAFSRLEENLNRAPQAQDRGSLDPTIPLAYVEAGRLDSAP